ncbi:MAG: hypothetical protein CMI08_11155 [Oceanospirillaceae bacterium]|uniref:hypothetical protein n=2 Tax=unclassified Thalassolituus TaxID=2624967 RepID=UPI000C4A4C29|nr:hypothetical protein [Thalassolituus sp. UBA1505]MAX99736.1 hypothetical protein [Oceanospirillaceae bacterium]MBL36404.1 hypothetical protein [Oceanospirillaceae bacterium]MBS52551.1 hypothetical protein [Oceanospirillaceae bacterium]|tara:strand:- start:4803 stop:5549 length:747 start_codon:yes stop_codon:yes gene_type:complete
MIRIIPIVAFLYAFILGASELWDVGFPDWQWDSRMSVVDNMNKYKFFNPYLGFLGELVILFILYLLIKGLYVDLVANEYTEGKVIKVEESDTRVNNRNLTNLYVAYMDVEGWFKDQPAEYKTSIKIGDRVRIRYQKGRVDRAMFDGLVEDHDESKLSNQSSQLTNESDVSGIDAYLKVTSIDFRPDAGAKAFEIKGVVQGSAHNGKEVTVFTDLEPSQVGGVTIGRLLPVVVSDNSVDDKIKFAEGAF